MKKLIIVTDAKTKAYGELLSALVTLKDDTEDGIVGVKDGTVEAVVWDDKTYTSNQAQLSSNNKVLFIGSNKVSKPVMSNINFMNNFTRYGIHMGYLGNKAAIDVDKRALSDKKLYQEFLADYKAFISNYTSSLIVGQNVDQIEMADQSDIDEKKQSVSNKIDNFVGKGFKGLNKGLRGLQNVSSKIANGADSEINEDKIVAVSEETASKTSAIINKAVNAVWSTNAAESVSFDILNAKSSKDVVDQQYRCAVIAFYAERLEAFMG